MSIDRTWTSPAASSTLDLATNDTLTEIIWDALISNLNVLQNGPQMGVRLDYVSATQIKAKLVNGGLVRIAGAWYYLSADLTAANTSTYIDGVSGNLAAATLYYVYLFVNSGTVTIDFSTTAYAVDTTAGNVGTYIKSGAASRTLIGMIRTNGSSQFADAATTRFVRSWYNDPGIAGYNNFTTARATTSTTFAELNSEIRVEFLAWSGEIVEADFNGTWEVSGNVGAVSVGFDGTTAEDVGPTTDSAADIAASFTMHKTGLTEGYHYATVLALNSGGSSTNFPNLANSAGKRATLYIRARR